MDVDGLLSEIFETIFLYMTRRSLPYNIEPPTLDCAIFGLSDQNNGCISKLLDFREMFGKAFRYFSGTLSETKEKFLYRS